MANGPLLFGVLLACGVLLVFVAIWLTVTPRDPVEARLDQFGVSGELAAPGERQGARRRSWPLVNRLLNGFGLGEKLALGLMRADLALTASEFALVVLFMAVVGLLVGLVRGSLIAGLVLALVLGYLPVAYLGIRKGRRLQAFTMQLPDVLTLLIGALRAGHGLAQSIGMLVDQVPAPASTEFARVQRGVSLGLSISRALDDMAERMGSDDLDLVVTAMNVQHEMGGDLAQTLDIIADTVRDRIRIRREIRTLTAQQRFTGYVLALLPVFLGIALYVMSPETTSRLFRPDRIGLPIAMVVLEVVGFLVIRKIVDIEV